MPLASEGAEGQGTSYGDALADLVQRYRSSADRSSDFVFVLDPESRIVYLNPRFARVLGTRAPGLIGREVGRLIPEGKLLLDTDEVKASDGASPPRVELRRRNGAVLWLELSLSPLVRDGQMLGWLGIGRDVTRQRQAEQRLLRRNRELSVVQVVVAEATRAIDLQATLDATLEQVSEMLDAEAGAVFLVDEGAEVLRLAAHLGISRAGLGAMRGASASSGTGPFDTVVSTGNPLLIENTAIHEIGALLRDERLRTFICAPLRVAGHIAGAIGLGRRRTEPFTAEDIHILTSLGDQVGIVIENARLHEEVTRRANRLALLSRTARAVAEQTTSSAVLSHAVRGAAQLSFSKIALALRWDASSGSLRAIAGHGIPASRLREIVLPAGDDALAKRLHAGQETIVRDLGAESVLVRGITQRLPEYRSLAVVPLRVQDQLIGALAVLHPAPAAYSPEDGEILSLLADQAAAALEHCRLREEAEEHAARLAVINEITKSVVSSLDPQHIFRSLALQIRRLVAFERISIAMLDEDAQTIEVFVLAPDGKGTTGTGTKSRLADAALGWVITNSRALLRGDIERETVFPWDGLQLAWGMRSDLTVPLASRGRIFGSLAVAHDELERYGQRDLQALELVAGQIAVAVENARLYQQTKTDLRELNALREVVEFFSGDLELQSVLQKIIAAAADFVQADSGSVALVDEREGTARLKAVYNLPASQLEREIAAGEGLLGQVLASRQPVVAHKYAEGTSAVLGIEDAASFLAVPISWQDHLIGVFAVGSSDPKRRFGQRDGEMLQLLAKHAAVAIDNARLYVQGRLLAVNDERNRLARDIHDTLAQSLTGVVLQLEAVADLFRDRPDEAWQELEEARNLARRALEEARQSIWALHPSPLQSLTLDEAIDREIRSLGRQANLVGHFSAVGDRRPLAQEIATTIFRIAQEALSNIRKHAAARTVQGALQFGEHDIALIIEDDGVGFVAGGSSQHSGFGLTSMRERARLVGGDLRVESAPRRGTRLTATIPYEASPLPSNRLRLAGAEPGPVAADAIKVIVADDHAIARQGIRHMLEQYADIAVVAEASDGAEAVALSHEHRPDVVLMDLQMPRLSGVDAIVQLREANAETKVLIISIHDKDEFLFDGIKAGARGYLLKDVPAEELARAVRAVSRGESLLQGVVAGKLLDRLGRMARGEGGDQITEREMEVMQLLASGARNKEIARRLCIGEKTVKFHVANIFRKLGASSRTEALAIALERGLLHR